jgi:hypothetical protein
MNDQAPDHHHIAFGEIFSGNETVGETYKSLLTSRDVERRCRCEAAADQFARLAHERRSNSEFL